MADKIPGKLLVIYLGTTPVGIDCLTDASIELSAENIDTTCKSNVGWAGSLPGIKSGSLSGTLLVLDGENTGIPGFASIFASFSASEQISWKISADVAGSTFLSGVGYFTSLSKQAGVNDAVTANFTISINGSVTAAVVPT